MSRFRPWERIRQNWALTGARVRRRKARSPSPDFARLALFFIAGVGLVLLTAVLYDARVIAWARTLPSPVHGAFAWITRFGQSDWLLVPTGVIVLVVALGDWRRVSRLYAAAWREIGTFAAVLFVVVAASGLVTDIVKPIVGRFRPDFVADGAFAFAPFSFGGYAHYSFPSGHATTMAAVAVVAAFVPGVVTVPIVVATALVAISRVMIGVHFPSDVVGGALIGLGVGYAILWLMTDAGIAFAQRPDGSVRRRFGVLRRLWRTGALAGLMPALLVALSAQPQRDRIPPADRQ